jgi:nucleoside-diphosphate-sugar epimerase
MKIFVTGATGFIGYSVVSRLSALGHEVFGLARSAVKASRLAEVEVAAVMGDMNDPVSYQNAAARCQVLIHCAAEYSRAVHGTGLPDRGGAAEIGGR